MWYDSNGSRIYNELRKTILYLKSVIGFRNKSCFASKPNASFGMVIIESSNCYLNSQSSKIKSKIHLHGQAWESDRKGQE